LSYTANQPSVASIQSAVPCFLERGFHLLTSKGPCFNSCCEQVSNCWYPKCACFTSLCEPVFSWCQRSRALPCVVNQPSVVGIQLAVPCFLERGFHLLTSKRPCFNSCCEQVSNCWYPKCACFMSLCEPVFSWCQRSRALPCVVNQPSVVGIQAAVRYIYKTLLTFVPCRRLRLLRCSGGGEGEKSNHRLTHRQVSHQNSKLGSCEVRTNMAGSSFVVCFQYITRSYYTSKRNWCLNCCTALKI